MQKISHKVNKQLNTDTLARNKVKITQLFDQNTTIMYCWQRMSFIQFEQVVSTYKQLSQINP